ncbi:hypothetical protein V8E54_007033 [Elaphomyces granulatus]
MHGPRILEGPRIVEDHHSGIDIIYDDADDMIGETGDGRGGSYGHGIGGVSTEGDLADGEGDDILEDDMMDKISSSPSIDDEDIDFEFVYALHTFVATVEGQANASKGETMVLLDDSNSYWWLVRVVKDGSIGYLPAEHIETPTERLARLNKHRNIDASTDPRYSECRLSATMLGDNPEKSKNPLKKAMRRRNAKTVTFASPTYFEASDIDYSTDEDQEQGEFAEEEEDISRTDTHNTREEIQDDDIVVEPLRMKQQKETEGTREGQEVGRASSERQRSSEELFDKQAEGMVSRSRNGILRNTDSFFKDDTVETKKISLTPNLLRDDSGSSGPSAEMKESRGSFETVDKSSISGEKAKRKDKKPGMLSGLFKRKDKKGKVQEDDGEEPEKSSEEFVRLSPQPKVSPELVQDTRPSKSQGTQRQSSKLQKHPPSVVSNKQDFQHAATSQETILTVDDVSSPTKEGFGPSIRRVVSPPSGNYLEPLRARSPDGAPEAVTSLSEPLKSSAESPPNKITVEFPSKLNENVTTQDSLDMTMSTNQSKPVIHPPEQFRQRTISDNQSTSAGSPGTVSIVGSQVPTNPPGLVADTSSQEERSYSPLSLQSSSSELVDVGERKDDGTPVSTVFSPSSAPSWSDADLRSYLDDEHDIRDLLVIVHDKSNVQPAGPDHPIVGTLFKEESKRLKEMSSQLDEYLANWITRKHHPTSMI